LELAPWAAGVHRQHAGILLAAGRKADALVAAAEAVRLAPDDGFVAAVNARVLLANGRQREAAAEIDRALALQPESAFVHESAALIQLHRGGGDVSVQRYRQALFLEPGNEAARHGLGVALKSRNPVYRALLLGEVWIASRPRSQRWLLRIAPFLALRVLRTMPQSPVTTALAVAIGVAVVLTWVTEPVLNLLLMTNRDDRRLLDPAEQRGALLFGACAAASIACFVGAIESKRLAAFGLGFALWALATPAVMTMHRRVVARVLLALCVIGLSAGVAGLVLWAFGIPGALAAAVVLVVTGVPALWVSAFAR
jgi:tetratricopeptide (TPR) repeat protein